MACQLRHRQDSFPVGYAIDIAYQCRWRRRQVAFGVGGVADRLAAGRGELAEVLPAGRARVRRAVYGDAGAGADLSDDAPP